jgi:hypothetical protein
MQMLVWITAFGLLGLAMITIISAASPYASVEVENGALSSGAQKLSDTTASSGSSVLFNSTSQPANMNVYFGSTHNHTGCCNDHGEDNTTPKDIFDLAKQYGLNFIFLTEHTNPRSVGDSVVQTAMSNNPTNWFNNVKTLAISSETSNFIGFAGVETGDPGSNHMTIVNQEDFYFAESPSANINYMVGQRDKGLPVFGNFNHPGATGHGGATTTNLNAKSREAMAFSGVQYGTTSSSRDGAGYSAYIVHLDRGWRVGPTCELDGHGRFRLADWGETRADTCRIGVLAPSLTRNNMNDAFANRRFFTARDTNMKVQYKANDQWMGSKIGKPSTVNFNISVSDPSTNVATDKIKKIEVVTEGGVIVASQTFDAHSVNWNPTVSANGKKYFFIRIFNGEYTYQAAVSSPVWLE